MNPIPTPRRAVQWLAMRDWSGGADVYQMLLDEFQISHGSELARRIVTEARELRNDVSASTYYVGTRSLWNITLATDAQDAIDGIQDHPDFKGRKIYTVRIATEEEIEQVKIHARMCKKYGVE